MSRSNRLLRGILGVLFLAAGVAFAAAPTGAAIEAVKVAGWLLLAGGVLRIAAARSAENAGVPGRSAAVSAAFWCALGVLCIAANEEIADALPGIAAVLLAAFGIWRLIAGVRGLKAGNITARRSVAAGVLALATAVVLLSASWVSSMESIGAAAAVGAFGYGFLLILNAFAPKPDRSPADIAEEDKEIAEHENAEFRKFEEKLEKQTHKS